MNGTTVVVVGDEPVAVLRARDLFEAAGLTVRAFGNGEQALTFLLSNQTEVTAVLTDMDLPGSVDGVTLARKVADTCPFIAVVETGECATRPDGLHPRARYLSRPWEPLDVINAILDIHQST